MPRLSIRQRLFGNGSTHWQGAATDVFRQQATHSCLVCREYFIPWWIALAAIPIIRISKIHDHDMTYHVSTTTIPIPIPSKRADGATLHLQCCCRFAMLIMLSPMERKGVWGRLWVIVMRSKYATEHGLTAIEMCTRITPLPCSLRCFFAGLFTAGGALHWCYGYPWAFLNNE